MGWITQPSFWSQQYTCQVSWLKITVGLRREVGGEASLHPSPLLPAPFCSDRTCFWTQPSLWSRQRTPVKCQAYIIHSCDTILLTKYIFTSSVVVTCIADVSRIMTSPCHIHHTPPSQRCYLEIHFLYKTRVRNCLPFVSVLLIAPKLKRKWN